MKHLLRPSPAGQASVQSSRVRALGFTLIELILVLSVGSMITLLSFQGMKRQTESTQARVVGQQILAVGQATDTYIAARYSQITQLTNAAGTATDPGPRTCAGSTCTITVQTLVNEGLLPPTYQNLNNFGSGYTITMTVGGSSPNWSVTGVVTTTNAWTTGGILRYDLLGQAMAAAGADSGMSRSSATQIDGYGGVWTAPTTTGKLGQLGFRVGTGTSLYSVYLRRDGTLPMSGDLNMSDGTAHNIYNTANVTGTGRFTAAQNYTNYVNLAGNLDMTGTATITGNANVTGNATVAGSVITNGLTDYGNATINGNANVGSSITAGGTIMAGGNIATNGFSPSDFPAGFAGGVRTWDIYAGGTIGVGPGGAINPSFAVSMNNAGNLMANGNIYGSRGIFSVGNGVQVGNSYYYGDTANSAIRQSGGLYIQNQNGTASADISQVNNVHAAGNVYANYLIPQGGASQGAGCSPNGEVGTDGSRALTCVNGVWRAPANYQCNGGGCWEQLSDGLIIQWGNSSCTAGGFDEVRGFPIAFPNASMTMVAQIGSLIGPGAAPTIGVDTVNNSAYYVSCPTQGAGSGTQEGYHFIAIGY